MTITKTKSAPTLTALKLSRAITAAWNKHPHAKDEIAGLAYLIDEATRLPEVIETLKAAIAWGEHPFRIEQVKLQPWFGRASQLLAELAPSEAEQFAEANRRRCDADLAAHAQSCGTCSTALFDGGLHGFTLCPVGRALDLAATERAS